MPTQITRIVSSSSVTQAQCRTHAPALATIAESLSGRVRYLYELATGLPAIEQDGIATPLNPQGRAGVDRSGPPWGDAFQHPIWVWEGTPASTAIYGEQPIVALSTNGNKTWVRARMIVRPFQQGPGVPYSLGELTIFGIRTSGATNATCVIKAYSAAYPTDDRGEPTPFRTATLTMTSSTTMNSAQIKIPLEPGYCARFIEFESTSANAFAITHMAINQVVRRSH
jgi:hypothetical protein